MTRLIDEHAIACLICFCVIVPDDESQICLVRFGLVVLRCNFKIDRFRSSPKVDHSLVILATRTRTKIRGANIYKCTDGRIHMGQIVTVRIVFCRIVRFEIKEMPKCDPRYIFIRERNVDIF